MKKHHLLALPMALLCSGCIPVTHLVTYEPSMAGATVQTDRCIGWKSLDYQAGDARLTISIERWPHVRHLYPALRVSARAPAGTKVDMAGREVDIRSPGLAVPAKLPIAGFGQDVSLATIPEGDLEIRLPDVVVDGKPLPVPPIRFRRRQSAVTFLPLNC